MKASMARARLAWRALGTALLVVAWTALGFVPALGVEPEVRHVTFALGDGGRARASTALGPLVAHVLVVPGDGERWRITVRNVGGSSAMLRADIVDVWVAGAADPQFLQDFSVEDLPLGELVGRRTTVFSQQVARGASASMELGYDFTTSARSGNHPLAEASRVHFDVEVSLRGSPEARVGGGDHRNAGERRLLGRTGAEIVDAALWAAAITAGGWAAWVLARRRRRDGERSQ